MRDVRIVVFGRRSGLAYSLMRQGDSNWDLVHLKWDVTRPLSMHASGGSVDIVVNCAAMTYDPRLTLAFDPSRSALSVNGLGAGHVALWARTRGAYLIHVSCDSVMGHQGPYYDRERPYPQDDQGYSKHVGELAVKALAGDHVIVRVGWMYGAVYPGCWPVVAATRHMPNISDDRRGQPVHVDEVARKILKLIAFWNQDKPRTGIIHVTTNRRPVTWYDYLAPHYPDIEAPRGRRNTLESVNGLFPSGEEWIMNDGIDIFKAEMSAQER